MKFLLPVLACLLPAVSASSGDLKVGSAAVDLQADDSMVIAGGITAGKSKGQEGKLRSTAVVIEKEPFGKLAIVACDVLMMRREHLDPAAAQIQKTTGIDSNRVLINCTHTHHAPSTVTIHGYDTDQAFAEHVQQAIVQAVRQANEKLSPCELYFHEGEENTVGENSRKLMDDGKIYWIGPRTNFVRDTGPFDPALPVFGFRDSERKWKTVIFGHSTHTIGTKEPGRRSPSFYGLAAQQLEAELGATISFIEGASGSTHNLKLSCDEATGRIAKAVRDALSKANPQTVAMLAAVRKPFTFRVRHFDEAEEDAAVVSYCRKYSGSYADQVIEVFRRMRKTLAPQQGQQRETWLQVMRIGDVAIVGVPAEFFTKLGLDIKRQSPFRRTVIAELANDWIGYLPDREGHKLGGYQVWTGYHSYAEAGTGERIVDETVNMLKLLAQR